MYREEQLEFLDLINIIGFVIGLLNYQENLTQGDKQDLMNKTDKQTEILLYTLGEEIKNQNKLLLEIKEKLA